MLMDPDEAGGVGDDFQAVRGIGRETARRLYDAGVRTFADLASHSPSEIATKARVQASRVEREDWVGQARERAGRSSRTGAEEPETAIDNGEHRESFILRLTLDDDNKVTRTVVTHVRSEREAPAWAGWDTAQLLEFLSEYCDLGQEAEATPTGGTLASAASAAEPEPVRPATAAAGSQSQLRLLPNSRVRFSCEKLRSPPLLRGPRNGRSRPASHLRCDLCLTSKEPRQWARDRSRTPSASLR
jgi:Helix-hairpin-helix domain